MRNRNWSSAVCFSGQVHSGGRAYQIEMKEWVADIRSACDFIAKHESLDSGRIGAGLLLVETCPHRGSEVRGKSGPGGHVSRGRAPYPWRGRDGDETPTRGFLEDFVLLSASLPVALAQTSTASPNTSREPPSKSRLAL